MAWIKIITEKEAEGLLAQIYETLVKRTGRVFNILKVQGHNPRALEASMGLYRAVMRAKSPLTRAQREMVALVISKANGCHY